MGFVDAGYVISLTTLAVYAASLVIRLRRERARTKGAGR